MSMRAIKARSMGRLALLSWLNELLESDYSRVEHLQDGIAFAQIFDALFPGKVVHTSIALLPYFFCHCEAP